MGGIRRDPEQVRERLREYIIAGGKKTWVAASKSLDIPRTTLQCMFSGNWEDIVDGIEFAPPPPSPESEFIAAIIDQLKISPKTIIELANATDTSPARITDTLQRMISSGKYEIDQIDQRVTIPHLPPPPDKLPILWPDGDKITTAHISDLHFGSIYHQGTALHHFAHYAADKGCEFCLVSGDITAGIYEPRDKMELYAYGTDEQIDAACDGIPIVEGLTWILSGGNHDYTHYAKGGTNVVRRICAQRKDCIYAGFIKADVPLTGNLKIRLWHPRGGKPYAKSYRGQKGAEVAAYDWLQDAVSEEEMAAIVMLQWGHTHYQDLFWYGPMMVFNPGCFEAEYPWEAAGGLSPEIGGVIKTTRYSGAGWGSIDEFEWLHYKPTKDDYKPIKHRNLMDFEEIVPLFKMQK